MLPLKANTDGVKVYNSSCKPLWLIQTYLGFLPPSIRFSSKNILIVASNFGIKKPKMTSFFYPFLKDLKEIIDRGGINFEHEGKIMNFIPFIFSCVLDLPAKSDVQGMVGHAGHFACSYCFYPGKSVKSDNGRKFIRYIKGDYDSRSNENVIDAYKKLAINSTCSPINGMKTVSCFIAAEHFDLIHSFAIDPMHCAHIGIMKKLLSMWLDSENHTKAFYIKKPNQIILSNRVVGIKPISEILRKPKSLLNCVVSCFIIYH